MPQSEVKARVNYCLSTAIAVSLSYPPERLRRLMDKSLKFLADLSASTP